MNFLKWLTTPLKGIPLEKVATDKKYIPTKKTEKFMNGNDSLWENPRFLIWQSFWPWMTFITSWVRVSHVIIITKGTSLSDQHFDTKHSTLCLVSAELWTF